jgi:predicted ATPase
MDAAAPRTRTAVGPYRILDPLGRGALSAVYRAEHLRTGRLVALKTVEVPWEGAVPALRREIYALSRLRHPGIVRILDSGAEQGLPWFAMELLQGPTLRQFGRERQPLSPAGLAEILALLRRLSGALAYLHGEGVLHRDLKPDNVLVRPDGRPVLVDFGVMSRFAGSLSRETLEVQAGAAGTLLYMAPEQIRGDLLDARADLYALGCMLYELVAGRPPFQGTAWVVRRAQLHEEPEPLSRLVPGLPEALDSLVLRLLHKEPQERLGYATDVAAELASLGVRGGWGETGPAPRPYLYRPRLAGREEAWQMLERHLDRLEHGDGGLLLVGGESGVGKTRLLLELSLAARQRKVRVLSGECAPPADAEAERGGAPALEALRRPLQALADRCRARGPEETGRLLGPRGRLLALYEPAMADLPGLESFAEPGELPPEAARLRLFGWLSETLAVLTQDGPVLLLLDDLHWADELTLGWLEFLARAEAGAAERASAMLVVGTYRAEEAGEALRRLADQPRMGHLSLGRLSERAVGVMAGDMLALELPPEPFAHFLERRSEGNPFFVAEVLRSAVAEGLLWRDELGRWQVAEPGEQQATEAIYEALRLPRSLRELVDRRLAGLPREASKLAEAAAVLGREVDLDLVMRMSGLDEEGLLEALGELQRRHVLEEAAEGRLRFVHDQIREVAYGRLGRARRKRLHAAAAQGIEARSGREPVEQMAALGHHWERAGGIERARECYLAAARSARDRYAHGEAERLYRAYLGLVEEPTSESIAARNELGDKVLELQGRVAEARTEHERSLSEARRLGDRHGEATSLRGLGTICWRTAQPKEARDLYAQALEIYRDLGDRRGEWNVLRDLAGVYNSEGRLREAQELYEQVLDLYRQAGDRRDEGLVIGNLAVLRYEQGHVEEALELYARALDRFRQAGTRRDEAWVLANLAVLHHAQGRLREARELYEQAVALHRQVGDRRREGITLGDLADLHQFQGRLQEAADLFDQALALRRQVGDRRLEAWLLHALAALRREQGRLEEARTLSEQALDLCRQVGERRLEARVLGALAVVHRDSGQVAAARALFEHALELCRQVGDRRQEGALLAEMSRLERQSGGSIEEALRLADLAESLLTSAGDRLAPPRALCERGHAQLARGQSAREPLNRARRLARGLGAGPGSALQAAIRRLRRAQTAFEAGQRERLFRGELVKDLPEGLRRWLIETGQLTAARG